MRVPTVVFEHLTLVPANRPDDRLLGTLFYDGADPYAVALAYVDTATEAQLGATFSRALMIDYLDSGRWIGPDRVLFGPHTEPGHTVITIAPDPQVSGSKEAILYCSTKQLQTFLDATLRETPLGAEDAWIDWSIELAELLPDRRRPLGVQALGSFVVEAGTLTAHWQEAESVIVQVTDAVGNPATWTISRAGLACAAIGARNGWFRLQVPDGPELRARSADVHAFLSGVGGAAA
jgi:hypothetical protein